MGMLYFFIYHSLLSQSDDESVFSLEGQLLEGKISSQKQKLVEAWIEIHKEELQANWKLLDEGEPFFRIEPLR